MEHHVALLALRLEIGQSLPVDQVAGPGDAGGGDGAGEVAGRGVGIGPFRAEDAVDPAVFMVGQAHVVDVGVGVVGLRHGDRVVAEPEVVHSVRTLRQCEEGLAVNPLHPDHQAVAVAEFDRAGVHRRVDADPLEQHRVGRTVEIVAPEDWCVLGGDDRVFEAVADAVAGFHDIFAGDKLFMFPEQLIHFLVETHGEPPGGEIDPLLYNIGAFGENARNPKKKITLQLKKSSPALH